MTRLTQVAAIDNTDGVDAVASALFRAVQAREKDSFADRERMALAISNEAVRRALEQSLQEIANDDDLEVTSGSERYRRHQLGEVRYHSLCGSLHVRRWTYRLVGVRNGPTIVPLELRSGLIENATPALAYAVTHGYAKAPIRSVRQDLEVAFRAPPSRATMERMAKTIGTDAKAALMAIENRVRCDEGLPSNATGITLGLDRTTIPMEEAVEGTSPSKITVNYRMAYVGTVALTDSNGEVLKSCNMAAPHTRGRAKSSNA